MTMLSQWSLPDLLMIREAYEEYRAKKSDQVLKLRANEVSENPEDKPDPEAAKMITKLYLRSTEVLAVINQKINEYEQKANDFK
jgi:hypothetical protein